MSCSLCVCLRRLGVKSLVYLACATCVTGLAVEPAISGITLSAGRVTLTITSSVGDTNLVQTTTDLAQPWTLLTDQLIVTQSAYAVTDSVSPAGAQRFYRVVKTGPGTAVPAGMALIPSGTFQMGDTFAEGESWELPVHTVYVSDFYMDNYEVTKALWDRVYTWALTNGYGFDNTGAGKGTNHPVQYVNWYDVVKWCNARSEMEGKVPAYYIDTAHNSPYRTGEVEPYVNWHAGYRLPTESEWEKADRGGASGHRFPWSDVDTIDHSRANYYSDPANYSYDLGPTSGFNPAFVDGNPPYTAPVGSFAPNGYGLYDTAGNVWEWTWDWAGSFTTDYQADPRGPITGTTRVGKGGNWDFYAAHCRNGYRYGNPPTHAATNIGFRTALPYVPPPP